MASYLQPPRLPATIQGDGKNFSNLVTKFMGEVADYINTANGFNEETTVPSNTIIQTPQRFYLQFDRTGGKFSWNAVIDDKLQFYELRLDDNAGEPTNAIATTTETTSTILPLTRAGKVYLYAKSSEGYSNPNIMDYSKPIPKSPTDISMSKTPEGTLIYFAPIPDDCIGCNVYVNGIKYSTLTNIFLSTGTGKIDTVRLAYYDTFGEGESINVYLQPLDVSGFEVYKNGNILNFTWNQMNIYGVHYIIHRGSSWETGEQICDVTGTNFKHIFPNTGTHIFWIKAVDEYGNMSENASWCTTDVAPDLNRNVVYTQNESANSFPGAKLNVTFEPVNSAIELNPLVMRGEYIADIELPKSYVARNWIDYNVSGVSDFSATWNDFNFTWDSEEAKTTWIGNIDNSGVNVKHQIARFIGLPSSVIEGFSLENNGTGINGTIATEDLGTSLLPSRFQNGIYITDKTKLSWAINIPQIFNTTFICRLTNGLADSVIFATLVGDNGKLFIGYNKNSNSFYLSDSNGKVISCTVGFRNEDYISFGISQSATTRALFVQGFVMNDTKYSSSNLQPISSFTNMYMYPKF